MRQNGGEKCGRVAVGPGPKTMNYREFRMVNFPGDACGKATAMQLIVQLEKMVNNLANSAPRLGYKRPCSYELFLFVLPGKELVISYGIRVLARWEWNCMEFYVDGRGLTNRR